MPRPPSAHGSSCSDSGGGSDASDSGSDEEEEDEGEEDLEDEDAVPAAAVHYPRALPKAPIAAQRAGGPSLLAPASLGPASPPNPDDLVLGEQQQFRLQAPLHRSLYAHQVRIPRLCASEGKGAGASVQRCRATLCCSNPYAHLEQIWQACNSRMLHAARAGSMNPRLPGVTAHVRLHVW